MWLQVRSMYAKTLSETAVVPQATLDDSKQWRTCPVTPSITHVLKLSIALREELPDTESEANMPTGVGGDACRVQC